MTKTVKPTRELKPGEIVLENTVQDTAKFIIATRTGNTWHVTIADDWDQIQVLTEQASQRRDDELLIGGLWFELTKRTDVTA